MSADLAFAIVDKSGNALRFDRFAYERSAEAARGDYHDANWLRCRITLHATIQHSVAASLLTTELNELSRLLKSALASPSEPERTFEPMEPYIELRVSRIERIVNVTARLDLNPAVGPVIEFDYECRPEEIALTIDDLERVQLAFPERRV
jgi:hypothetical protein